MFESLSDRLGASLKAISGKSKLTEDNIRDTLRDVRMTLLEADVALPVVKTFTDRVKDRAVGTEVSQSPIAGSGLPEGGSGRVAGGHGWRERGVEPSDSASCRDYGGGASGCG